jgi:excisionase family DNA binding protein
MKNQDSAELQLVADGATGDGAPLVGARRLDGTQPPLMTAEEVAELLRVRPSTVYELARNRRIPFLKVGRRTLFARESLLDWIAAQTVQPRR